ncbi:hypothetical protein THIOSC15_610002 [uncultured Thiomicrorhabdus sp.]
MEKTLKAELNSPVTADNPHLSREHIAAIEQGFTQAINRENTFAEKYDLRQRLFGTDDVLPMWVADMDLPTPPFIIETLQQRLEHPVLGYNLMPETLYQSIIDWQAQHHYVVQRSHIRFTHNVANGFFMAVQAFSQAGDGILVMPPIYPPFLNAASQWRQTIEDH